jgi:hypothetical protein
LLPLSVRSAPDHHKPEQSEDVGVRDRS